MLDDTVRRRISERLKDTQLRQVIAGELSALCAQKPSEVSFEAFCSEVVTLFLTEFHQQLLEACGSHLAGPAIAQATGEGEPGQECNVSPDLDTIITSLRDSFHQSLLVSNMHMLRALGSAIAERDTGTAAHNHRVTYYAIRIGQMMRINRGQMSSLIKGAFLHDIGKIGIPDSIMLKPSGLTPEERRVMDSHVQRGAHIIRGVVMLDDARDVVQYHHEKWDGTGYVEGLAGEDIPLNARIFAVGDVFDAITTDRPYKPASTYDEAMAHIRAEAGHHFDPHVVHAFEPISWQAYDDAVHSDGDRLEHRLAEQVSDYFEIEAGVDSLPSRFK